MLSLILAIAAIVSFLLYAFQAKFAAPQLFLGLGLALAVLSRIV
jgi:hypothetical protein